MPSISAIVSFLRSHDLLVAAQLHDDSCEVDSVAADNAAGPAALAWISRKNLAREPQRWRAFKGALLILPQEAELDPSLSFSVLLARDPKLSFIRAVGHFFEHLTTISLPALGAAPIAPDAEIGRHVTLAAGCVIGPKVRIADHVAIGANTVIANCEIASGVRIGCNCSIGLPGFGYEKDDSGSYWRFPHLGGVRIERDVEIGSNTCIDRGSLGDTVIGAGSKIDNLVHVAHNVVLGSNTIVIANSMLGGSVSIGDGAWVAPSVTIMNQASIGAGATLGLGAVVLKDVGAEQVIVGNPGRVLDKKPKE
jgi:UDP-3-O-[3-hydroxymyristoyl] glucosamine N-acyltransferase